MTSSGSNAQQHARRSRSTLRAVLALAIAVVITVILWAWIAPHIHMGTAALGLLFFLAVWAAFTVILVRAFARTMGMRVLLAAGALFLVWAIIAVETRLLVARRYSNPPPRPMFQNYFGLHEITHAAQFYLFAKVSLLTSLKDQLYMFHCL